MTNNINFQDVEEQEYQLDLINNLVDITQDNLSAINESLLKYKHHEFTSDELIMDVIQFLPKIDTLLKVIFDKSLDSKDQLNKIVSDSIHDKGGD